MQQLTKAKLKAMSTEELVELVRVLCVLDNDKEVNLTPIARLFNKRIDKFRAASSEILYEIASTQNGGTGQEVITQNGTSLFRIKQGGNGEQGTFTKSPEVLIELLRYCSAKIAVKMTRIIWELFEKGTVSIKPVEVSKETPLLEHTKRPIQVENAKGANKISFSSGGVDYCIEWNTNVAKSFTGYTPKQLLKIGKEFGLPSKQRTSGKEVIRAIRPDKAACVSLADYYHANGVDDNEAIALAQSTLPAMQKLIEINKKKELK